eukprot:9087001-Pyramimonas_sp.AAC.1
MSPQRGAHSLACLRGSIAHCRCRRKRLARNSTSSGGAFQYLKTASEVTERAWPLPRRRGPLIALRPKNTTLDVSWPA